MESLIRRYEKLYRNNKKTYMNDAKLYFNYLEAQNAMFKKYPSSRPSMFLQNETWNIITKHPDVAQYFRRMREMSKIRQNVYRQFKETEDELMQRFGTTSESVLRRRIKNWKKANQREKQKRKNISITRSVSRSKSLPPNIERILTSKMRQLHA